MSSATQPHEIQHGDYLISDDEARLDVDAIHAFLSRCHWAEGIDRETVARAVQNSLNLGIYDSAGRQVGLVRVITDYATFAYVCDVYVLEPHRGRGLAKAALSLMTTHPRLKNQRRQHLVTPDTQGLYEKFGFSVVQHPERHLEKMDVDVYPRLAAGRS